MSFARLRYSVSAMPVMSGLLSAYLAFSANSNPLWVLAWGACYLIVALRLRIWHKHFSDGMATGSASTLILSWQRRLEILATAHGVGMALLVPLTMGHGSNEFMLLLYVALVSVLAANSGQITPFFSIFQRLFWGGIGVLVLMPWSLPTYWHYLLPMSIVMSLAMYRSAVNSHLFFVRQVELEELSRDLAIRYRHASEAADEAVKQRSDFLATASHDLRQPIHAMSLLTHAALQCNRDERVGAMLNDLNASMDALTLMFNALLDLSRLESGALQSIAKPLSLSHLVEQVAKLMQTQAQQRELQIRVRVPQDGAWVRTDPVLLRQALINLIHNALRYTRRGGILIAVRRLSGSWQIEVWDTGIGIATSDQELIFMPYFRHELAWRIDNAGHGLGLAVVARCAKLMQATLGVHSRLGHGSRFWLRLGPVADLPASSRPNAEKPEAVEFFTTNSLSGRCLVVEDDPAVQSAWHALLTNWGLDTRFAGNGEEAFAFLDTGFLPDAILCDQRLRSGESGFELLGGLLTRCPRACGAMVSGEVEAPELILAEDQGYLVLRKPIDVRTLHGLLQTWLG